MLYILLALVIVACIILVFIILMQSPKGGGLSGSFGGAATQMFGARQSADFLEKATWYFGIGILVIVATTYFLTSSGTNIAKDTNKPKVTNALDYQVTGESPATTSPAVAPPTTAPVTNDATPPAQTEEKPKEEAK